MLPDDWQARFVDMVRGAVPADPAWFGGGPRLRAADQLQVYALQYQLRLIKAVRDEVPGLVHLLGDDADDTVAAFLGDRPSRSWTLNHVAEALPGWLEARGAPSAHVDMARVDLAVQRGFDAADVPPLDPAALATVTRLRLAPCVTLLRLRTNAHQVRSKAMVGEAVGPPVRGLHRVVIHRVDRRMRHWGAPAGAFGLLEAFRDGTTLPAALERVFQQGLLDPETAAADVQAWFATFAEKQLVALPEGRSA